MVHTGPATDAAHSLSDSFEVPLGNTPVKIIPNLFGQEINALEEVESKWGEIKSYLNALFASQGPDTVEAQELSVFPGMEELFNLIIPQETHEHLAKARKEVLLVLRSIIDARIAAMEKKEAGRTAAKRKIKVE